MSRLLVVTFAAFAAVSLVVFGVAQGELPQVELGTLVTWTADGTPAVTANTVSIVDTDADPFSAFEPMERTVPVGGTVIWENLSLDGHTVVSDPESTEVFKSGENTDPIATNGSFAHAFETAGSYSYHCGIHPAMKGTIVVE
jgi:plastocyanin